MSLSKSLSSFNMSIWCHLASSTSLLCTDPCKFQFAKKAFVKALTSTWLQLSLLHLKISQKVELQGILFQVNCVSSFIWKFSDWVSLFTGLDYWSHLFATKNHFYARVTDYLSCKLYLLAYKNMASCCPMPFDLQMFSNCEGPITSRRQPHNGEVAVCSQPFAR